MSKLKKLELNVFGLALSWYGDDVRGASIRSDMKDDDVEEDHPFNAAVDAIESLVLAHFCAGVDVSSPAYLEGVESAYQAIGNEFSD